MLCDVRRDYKTELQRQDRAQQQIQSTSSTALDTADVEIYD